MGLMRRWWLVLLFLPLTVSGSSPPVLERAWMDVAEVEAGSDALVHLEWATESNLLEMSVHFDDAHGNSGTISSNDCTLERHSVCRMHVPASLPPSTYTLWFAHARDDAGNEVHIQSYEVPFLQFALLSNVTDRQAPTLLEVVLSPSVLAPGEVGWLGLRFDEPEPVRSAYVQVEGPGAHGNVDVLCRPAVPWTVCKVRAEWGIPGGAYRISSITGVDQAANARHVDGAELKRLLGGNATVWVESAVEDTTPPTFQKLSVQPSGHAQESFRVDVEAEDASGLRDVVLFMLEYGVNTGRFYGKDCVRSPGGASCLFFADDLKAGTQEISGLAIVDSARNKGYVWAPNDESLEPKFGSGNQSVFHLEPARWSGPVWGVHADPAAVVTGESIRIFLASESVVQADLQFMNGTTEVPVEVSCQLEERADLWQECRGWLPPSTPDGLYFLLHGLYTDAAGAVTNVSYPYDGVPVFLVGEPLSKSGSGAPFTHPRPAQFDEDPTQPNQDFLVVEPVDEERASHAGSLPVLVVAVALCCWVLRRRC